MAPNQTREEVHQLVYATVIGRRPMAAIYDGCQRLLCPHKLGWNRGGQLRVLCYQYGGESVSGLQSQNASAIGAAWPCRNSGPWSCSTTPGMVHRITLSLRLASSASKSMWRITRRARHKTDSKATAGAGGARWRCAGWRSSGDYAARDEGGEPRGWKSDGISGCGSPR
jgi:hypothetical protein